MEQTTYKPHSTNAFLADVLLPCPFCGKEPELKFIGNDYSKSRKVEVKCKGCRARMVNAGIRANSEQLAKWSIEAWNQRSLQPKGKTKEEYRSFSKEDMLDCWNAAKQSFFVSSFNDWFKEKYTNQQPEAMKEGWVSVPDVRNKLGPFANLIAMIDSGLIKITTSKFTIVSEEIEQCRKSLEYLSNPPQK